MNARARKKIIQFPHPSGEECSKNIVNGVKRWNDGRHKRNFIEILGFAISVAVLFFTACGDSGSSASGFESDFSYTEETLDDLPNCTAEREQDTAFVRDGNEIYVCEDSRWKFVRAVIDSVKTVDDLSACTNSREGDSVLVTSLNAVYVCGDGKWYKVDVEDLLESSSSVSPGSSSDGWEKLPSSSSSSLLVVSSSSEAVSSSSSVLVVSSSSEVVSSSSSLLVVSSSSEVVSSSSSPAVSYGKLTDARDGQVYKTVQIGGQVWMAENLNYAYNEGTAKSYCYENSADSCAKYGRLYLWSAAMDSAGVFSTAGKGCGYRSTCEAGSATTEARGVCPEGWHLPSKAEFETLFAAVGGWDVAGKALKSTSGWTDDGNGTDSYGFSALPAGIRDTSGDFYSAGYYAGFWSATEGGSNDAYYMGLFYYNDGAYLHSYYKYSGFSVRCLRNSFSSAVSSSSAATSSSSSVAVSYGKLTDARDGQVYKTVQIGGQVWMAENLNYAYNEGTAKSYCYENSADSCAKYGRLYLWSAAMDSAAVFGDGGGCGDGLFCEAGSATFEVQGVCPAGWHLPRKAEFETLFAAVGGKMVAVKALKSTSGWMEDGNGTDVYGFSALPAGYYNDGNFFNVGSNATFWSATEGSSNYAYAWYLSAGSAYLNGLNKGNGSAVRCLRNSPL